MAEPALLNAERRREELAAEINKLQTLIEQKRRELERVKGFIDDYRAFSVGIPELPLIVTPASKRPGRKPVNPDRSIVGDQVEAILREAGGPLSREQLFAHLDARGMTIIGKDPQMVLSTMLWRMPERFVRLPGHGYWVADEPWPPAGYVPKK